jgi:hypothetical protein
MNVKTRGQRAYGSSLAKTFPVALSQLIAQEFPHLGGPKVRELFVVEVTRLVEQFYPPRERLRLGQTLWLAVDKTARPHDHLSLAETRMIPVVLTLVAPDDIRALVDGASRTQVSEQAILRLHREADEQGAVLSETDTALLLCYTPGHISDLIRAYETRTGEIVPRRGTIHDLGSSVTHKRVIAHKVLCQRKSTAQTASETYHTPESVDRYLRDLIRCYICLKRADQSVEQTAFATGLSVALVREYAALIEELGLTDESLKELLPKLEAAQTERREQQAK